jgi:hypothetical protein
MFRKTVPLPLTLIFLALARTISAQEATPSWAVVAHPIGLSLGAIPMDSDRNLYLQFDALRQPTGQLVPVASFAWHRLTVDYEQENTTIDRLLIEAGVRRRFSETSGWYAQGSLGYLFESYQSVWWESTSRVNGGPEFSTLTGDVDNSFQDVYAIGYLGWASSPKIGLRWDFNFGLGYALGGGVGDLHDVKWTGDRTRIPKAPTVDLFATAPLVIDINIGLGWSF